MEPPRPAGLASLHESRGHHRVRRPETVKAVDGEVVAQGRVDLDSTVGREAWRSFKSRAIGFSFGYLTIKTDPRPGGGRHITELDVLEVTATPTPMNNATHVLDVKALDTEYDEMKRQFRDDMLKRLSHGDGDPLRQKAERIAREHAPIQTATFDC